MPTLPSMSSDRSLQIAYAEGGGAFILRHQRKDNPYIHVLLRTAWSMGFDAAQAQELARSKTAKTLKK